MSLECADVVTIDAFDASTQPHKLTPFWLWGKAPWTSCETWKHRDRTQWPDLLPWDQRKLVCQTLTAVPTATEEPIILEEF